MSTKPLWKGVLIVGALRVPVMLLGARDRESTALEFNTAHRCGGGKLTRINAKRWCPSCDDAITETARVFEHARGRYVEISDDELKACELAGADELAIAAVIDSGVNPLFIETTAQLVADGADAELAIETLRRGLGTATAIAAIVLKKRRTFIALHAMPSGFLAYVLRGRSQVCELLHRPSPPASPSQQSVSLARQMFAGLKTTFDYDDVPDTYGERVKALVDKKIAAAAKSDLAGALKQSAKKNRRKK